MADKSCPDCGQDKPMSEFYLRRDGRPYSYCKACVKAQASGWKKSNPERSRQIGRMATAKHHKKYPGLTYRPTTEAVKAHSAVSYAVRSGKMKRPESCSSCGGGVKIHAHHESYERKLDVQWLCAVCHWEADRGRRCQKP